MQNLRKIQKQQFCPIIIFRQTIRVPPDILQVKAFTQKNPAAEAEVIK
jgi:hypothetical protein